MNLPMVNIYPKFHNRQKYWKGWYILVHFWGQLHLASKYQNISTGNFKTSWNPCLTLGTPAISRPTTGRTGCGRLRDLVNKKKIRITVNDMVNSLKSKCLTWTHKETSHSTRTLNTKILFIYLLISYIKFKQYVLFFNMFRLNIFILDNSPFP